MVSAPTIAIIGNILQLVGAFVSLSIAYVSYRGVRQTESPSLLRLATAFFLLGVGFMIEAIVGFGSFIPWFSALATTVVVTGLLLETTGYFFLAFSHVVDVMLAKKLGIALMVFPILTMSTGQLSDILGFLSFFFVLYGVVETLYAYSSNKRPDTLLIATGLALLGVGTFVQWLSPVYFQVDLLTLVQIITKEIGLLILFVPVLKFALGGEVRIDGPV
ncbi:MAG: hypothetical protein JRN24_00640 [Nitrososphaerota archaeon]|nr:hypothetical protein [Nitrososphaerota archaeon]